MTAAKLPRHPCSDAMPDNRSYDNYGANGRSRRAACAQVQKPLAIVPTTDAERSKDFYGDVLGLFLVD